MLDDYVVKYYVVNFCLSLDKKILLVFEKIIGVIKNRDSSFE